MVIADPTAELLRLVTDPGDPPPRSAAPGARRAAELIRRRFGLALPPPFADGAPGEQPIRPAVAADGAAIAAVKWRCFGTNYRGILSDRFLDGRDIVPPASFWTGRAMLPPSRRHRLWVCGRPGVVFGYADTGPALDDEAPSPEDDPDDDVGEVYELYVDPTAQGGGIGGRLLAAAVDHFTAVGFVRAELDVLADNGPAQAFYRARGWAPTGRVTHVDLGVVAFDEARYARPLGAPPS